MAEGHDNAVENSQSDQLAFPPLSYAGPFALFSSPLGLPFAPPSAAHVPYEFSLLQTVASQHGSPAPLIDLGV